MREEKESLWVPHILKVRAGGWIRSKPGQWPGLQPLGLAPHSSGCSFGKTRVSQLEACAWGTALYIGDLVP